MPKIEQEGKYIVRLRELHWEETMKGMALVMPGCAVVDGEERHITGRLHFTGTLVGGGRNKGKPLYESNAQLCVDIGMSAPFSPTKISELEDAECEFVVEEEEYKGVTSLRVAFIHSLGNQISEEDAEAIWTRMTGGKPIEAQETRAKPKPKPAELDDEDPDNLPF